MTVSPAPFLNKQNILILYCVFVFVDCATTTSLIVVLRRLKLCWYSIHSFSISLWHCAAWAICMSVLCHITYGWGWVWYAWVRVNVYHIYCIWLYIVYELCMVLNANVTICQYKSYYCNSWYNKCNFYTFIRNKKSIVFNLTSTKLNKYLYVLHIPVNGLIPNCLNH